MTEIFGSCGTVQVQNRNSRNQIMLSQFSYLSTFKLQGNECKDHSFVDIFVEI
uniref:Uncharacterized protein n=1 Tax=Rhizophora mucronata TaxID=61149 RepID=A0A2P2PFC7_RHIMU